MLTEAVANDELVKNSPAEVLFAAQRLENIRAVEAIPALVKRTRLTGQSPPRYLSTIDMLPIRKILVNLAYYKRQETADALVEQLATHDFSSDTVSDILFVLGLSYAGSSKGLQAFLWRYQDEYRQRANRLRLLSPNLDGRFNPTPPDTPLPDSSVTTDKSPVAQSINEDRAIQFIHLLTDDTLTPTDEHRVLQAISNLPSLGHAPSAQVLTQKLDDSVPRDKERVTLTDAFPFKRSIEEGPRLAFVEPMYISNLGLQSPAITAASIKSLRQMGSVALPALIQSVSHRGRTARFRHNALPLIVAAAGDVDQAREALENAAAENDKKVANLAKVIESIPQDHEL